MKGKLFYSAIVLLLCILPAPLRAQVSYGVRMSYDVTFPVSSDNPYNAGSGVTVGGVANFTIPKKMFVEPGLMFSFCSMPSKDLISFDNEYYYEGSARFYTVHVPLNFGYRFYENGNWSFAVSTGPYLDINVSARQKLEPNFGAPKHVPDKRISLFDHGWKKLDGGWNIRLSTTFAGSYFVGVSGGMSFTPLAKYGNNDKKIKIYRSTVSVVLGYYF